MNYDDVLDTPKDDKITGALKGYLEENKLPSRINGSSLDWDLIDQQIMKSKQIDDPYQLHKNIN